MDNAERRRDEDNDDEDDESEMEWEEVVQPAAPESAEASTSKRDLANGSAGPLSNGYAPDGIEVTLKKSAATNASAGKGKGKGKGRPAGFSVEAALQRAHRQELHKLHASCLLLSGHVRNGWINDKTLQARLMSKTPLHLQNNFHNYSKTTHPKQHDRSRLFENAMRALLSWWTERFFIEDAKLDLLSEESLFDLFANPQSLQTYDYTDMKVMLEELSDSDRARLMMPFAEEAHLQELLEAFPPKSAVASAFKTSSKGKGKQKMPKLPKPVSQELGELIRNPQSLAKRAVKLSGTKDVSVQLFTSLCRALDIPARLVCSLPAVDYRSANKMKADDRTADIRTGGSGKAAGKKRKRAGDGNASASVSFDDTNNEDEEDDDDEFEEVAIPSSLPSKGLKKAANARIASNTASPGTASDASTTGTASKMGSKMSRQKRAASLFAARKGKARAQSYEEEEAPAIPAFWTEVYNRSLQEWITIDVVHNRIRPKKGDLDNGRLFYVVAYEVDQYIKDVTPRYAKSYAGRTLKMRIATRKKDDPDWWEETLAPWQRPFMLGRELKEDEELAKQQETEPMPTVLEGFKNHPRYVLERHLKREEVIPPKTKQLGLFRGEPVYPRGAVLPVKSSETWMREGLRIKEGEQALKMVKQRAVTINKRRMQEMAEQEGFEPVMQGLYSRSQTEKVIPPPLVDGKVPKNSFGNMDLFAPHMLPKGAAHLPYKSIKKIAKDLGIDFAEAITGFEFHKRRAVPVISGIVIAQENQAMLLEAYYASETMAVEKEMQKRRDRCLKRWKKLIIGLRLRSRLQGEYKGDKSEKSASKAKTGNNKDQEVSQFQSLSEDVQMQQAETATTARNQPPDPSATQNGFIHLDKIDASIPGGAAFPGLASSPGPDEPKVDIASLNLPPMPAPAPASENIYNEVNLDDKVKPASGVVAGKADVDLDDFTLADPEEIADGGEEIHSADENPFGGGGFMREEDEEAEKQYKSKDFALHDEDDDSSDADMVEVAPSSSRKKGKQPVQSEPDDEETEEEDNEADYEEESARRTRAPAPRTRSKRPAKNGVSEDDSDGSAARRTTRASAAKVNGNVRAARPASAKTTPARPTRAAARKVTKTNVVELSSGSEDDD